jgi:hypothetical protein
LLLFLVIMVVLGLFLVLLIIFVFLGLLHSAESVGSRRWDDERGNHEEDAQDDDGSTSKLYEGASCTNCIGPAHPRRRRELSASRGAGISSDDELIEEPESLPESRIVHAALSSGGCAMPSSSSCSSCPSSSLSSSGSWSFARHRPRRPPPNCPTKMA